MNFWIQAFIWGLGVVVLAWMLVDSKRAYIRRGQQEGRQDVWNEITERYIKAAFPLSFKFKNGGLEFEKLYRIIEAKRPQDTVDQPYKLEIQRGEEGGTVMLLTHPRTLRHELTIKVEPDIFLKNQIGKELFVTVSGEFMP